VTSSSKRQKELARRRAERQAARRIERQRQRRKKMALTYGGIFALVLLLILGLTVGRNLFEDDASTVDPAAQGTPTPSVSASPVNGCYVPDPKPNTAGKEPGIPPAPNLPKKKHTATVTYDKGTVVFEMLADKAPCTVNSFVHLAAKNFFDGTTCHRVTSSPSLSVLQCGDPTGTGGGGPGYSFKDENLAGATYKRGTVAMANAGPGTNGSQFFLVAKDSQLPPNYTVFGRITSGLEFIDSVIAKGSTPPTDGKPKEPVNIKDFTVKVT
jgi:peptidyl-prolyl cis-trans isomerase B (cyclophilin B)